MEITANPLGQRPNTPAMQAGLAYQPPWGGFFCADDKINAMLSLNANKVKNLTGAEIWLFIIARILVGFGAGAILACYYPQFAFPIGVSILVIGILLFLIPLKGMFRKNSD
jgi:hypothetical protein